MVSVGKSPEMIIRISGNSAKFDKELRELEAKAAKTTAILTANDAKSIAKSTTNFKAAQAARLTSFQAGQKRQRENFKTSQKAQTALSQAELKRRRVAFERNLAKQKTSFQSAQRKRTTVFDRDIKKRTALFKKAQRDRTAISKKQWETRIGFAKRAAQVTAAITAVAVGVSIRNFAEFEQGLAGVSKTTNIAGKELEDLGDEITKIAIKTGISTRELLELAKTAGQLGVTGSKSILKFTETLAGLAKTTNIAGEGGAIALARLIKITGETTDNVDRLGAAIVDLGNNSAALENEILFTATEIAGAGAIFGVTAEQALGLAAAFSELAVRPELARTVINRSFNEIGSAITEGGEKLQRLIALTGMTEDQLRKTFKENAPEVFRAFLVGLQEINSSGEIGALTKALNAFGLSGLRLEPSLAKLALGSKLVGVQLDRSKQAFKDNTALQKELGIQLDTTAARAKIVREEYAAVSRELGEEFIPVTEDALEALKLLAPFITENLVPALGFLIDFLANAVNGFKLVTDAALNLFEKLDAKSKKTFGFGIFEVRKSDKQKLQDDIKDLQDDILAAQVETASKQLQGIKSQHDKENEQLKAHREKQAEINTEANEQDIENEAEVAAAKAAVIDADRVAQLDKDEENREKQLELEEERFQEDMETLLERVAEKESAKDFSVQQQNIRDLKILKAKAKTAKDEEKIDIALNEAEKKLEIDAFNNTLDNLERTIGAHTTAGKAIFLIKKAQALSQTIVNTARNVVEAGTNLPLAALMAVSGAAQAAVITSTAIQGLSAQDGGVVPGGFGGGDRVPALLEPGEIIIPQSFNPLSPNFEDTFGGGGGTDVNVTVGIEEDASQIITIRQREDSALGIQR